MRLAFFDVDYTLYKGFTVVQFFKTFAENNHRLDLISERKLLETEVKHGTIDHQRLVEWSMSLAARAVEGFSVDKVALEIKKTIDAEGEFFPWVGPLLLYLKEKNFRVYLISASIEPMIAEIALKLEIHHYFATMLEVVNGIYTGKVLYVRNGQSKLDTLNSIIKDISEQNDVIAFGDSDGDVAMLSAADQGFVIDPVEYSDKLLATARKKGWPILRHDTALEQIKQTLTEKFGI
ncbi:MAG TPA: HAD-IB family phosphatase [Candidatus Woesebacteria bacterium]|nr:HAD-IB family phosphatase [Candidatus Woesebacteria bacterium]